MNVIKRIRTQVLKLTQVEFGKAIGKPQVTVSRWETGGDDPRMSSLARILAAYPSLDARELFKTGDEGDENAEKMVLEQGVEPGPVVVERCDSAAHNAAAGTE